MDPDMDSWLVKVTLTPPSLADNSADTDRLLRALKRQIGCDQIQISLELMRRLPEKLRQWQYAVQALCFKTGGQWHLIDLFDATAPPIVAGLAVDLGTSRVVVRLMDMDSQKNLGETTFDNPQTVIGPDILTRIHYADTNDGLTKLQKLIVDGINNAIVELCQTAEISRSQIHLVVVAGNTAMTHLLLGLEPRWMIREPYIPVVNQPGLLVARELGVEAASGARLMVFPNVGSYFGGDLIAGILYAGLHQQAEMAILVDVGTNAEVVLGNQDWLIACAGAAGPALEGGVTRMGMMAGPGVIDQVSIDTQSGRYDLHTIDGKPPVGICGSGLIDLAAQLHLNGMIDLRGKLVAEKCGNRFVRQKEINGLLVVSEEESGKGDALVITQVDIDSLIRSKAAMYTILETIVLHVGLTFDMIETFGVAGTFGSFINPESAITIGMLPDLPRERFKVLGNSSLEGAARLLTTPSLADEIGPLRDNLTYLELNVNQEFMNRFSAAKFLPHTDISRFPTVSVALSSRAEGS